MAICHLHLSFVLFSTFSRLLLVFELFFSFFSLNRQRTSSIFRYGSVHNKNKSLFAAHWCSFYLQYNSFKWAPVSFERLLFFGPFLCASGRKSLSITIVYLSFACRLDAVKWKKDRNETHTHNKYWREILN